VIQQKNCECLEKVALPIIFFTSTCLGSLGPFTCVCQIGNWKLLFSVAMKKIFSTFFYMLYGRYVSFKVEMNMMRALKIYDSL